MNFTLDLVIQVKCQYMKRFIVAAGFLLLLTGVKAQSVTATIDHVALYVRNVDSSAQFYKKLFDLKTIPNPFPGGKVVWFSIGKAIQLHLVEGLESPSSGPFMSHICFSVVSLKDFILTLDKNGMPYYSGPTTTGAINHRPDGIDQIFVKDPDDYWVEINNVRHQ